MLVHGYWYDSIIVLGERQWSDMKDMVKWIGRKLIKHKVWGDKSA